MFNNRLTTFTAVTLFFGSLAYYLFTGYFLPERAAPDYPVSQAAVHFYMEHGRLAVMPQDEDIVNYSPYGNTRSMRPPLGFASAAMLAKLSPFLEDNWRFAYRHAAALFCALTVLLTFLGLMLYFNRWWLAFLGSILLALMPQFTFTGSYLNDDSSAFFAAAYLFYAMIHLLKRGVSYTGLTHFGLAAGLVIISKMTAWLMLPGVFIFYLVYVFRFNQQSLKQLVWVFVFFIIGGGWWCLWNMWHYGWHDPFILEESKRLVSTYNTVDLSQYGFIAKNVGFRSLLLYNHLDFWGATFKAVVGHIDWVKVRMDSFQYNYYAFYVWFIALYLISSAVTFLVNLFKRPSWSLLWPDNARTEWVSDVKFEAIIVFIFAVQMLVYTWHNIYNDIQIQGKYLLPIVFPLLLLALSFFMRASIWLSPYVPKKVQLGFVSVMLILPFVVHADAIFDVVIPYYWPNLL